MTVVGEDDIRRLALAMPEVVEMDHHGVPSFRVGGKIFCTVRSDPPRIMVKLHAEDQHNLCAGWPDTLEPVPGYWGTKGSTFVDLSKIDEAFVTSLLGLAYANVAPGAIVDRR